MIRDAPYVPSPKVSQEMVTTAIERVVADLPEPIINVLGSTAGPSNDPTVNLHKAYACSVINPIEAATYRDDEGDYPTSSTWEENLEYTIVAGRETQKLKAKEDMDYYRKLDASLDLPPIVEEDENEPDASKSKKLTCKEKNNRSIPTSSRDSLLPTKRKVMRFSPSTKGAHPAATI